MRSPPADKRRRATKPKTPATGSKSKRSYRPKTVVPSLDAERVFALDSSSRACGWSIFDNGQLIAYGCFRQTGSGHGEKLMNFRAWLLSMFADWKPDLLIYEAPYQGRMKNTFGILSRYVGVIEASHYEFYGREIEKSESVPAHMVKRAIGAKKGIDHDANKKIVLQMVNQKFSLRLKFKSNDTTKKVSQDDDADAIALNWAWHILNRDYPKKDIE
jgi:Holliday junction resolvasome RuvABC endonuclease subunit